MSFPTLDELRSTDPKVSDLAWARAYPILWDRVIRLLHSKLLVGAQHEQQREDIAAQALEQVVRGLIEKKSASFNQIASFDDVLGMTFRILRARVADFFRHRDRHPEELTDEIPEQSIDAEETALSLNRQELEALLDQLPPPQPELFRELYFLGCTAAEIAEARSMPRNTVLSHLHRGKKTLRRLLLGDDAEAPTLRHPGLLPRLHD